MKLSIITVTLNSEKTIRDTLNSVLSQSSKCFEHIIVDGGSTDKTLSILKQYPNNKKKVFIKKKFGIYKSINYAINKSQGEFICILNSDDIFHSNNIIETLSKIVQKNKTIDIFLGDVAYFDKVNYHKVSRFYSAKKFKTWKMKLGLMPPHPASIIKKKIYLKHGLYYDYFKIAGDFELFLRLIFVKKINYKIINKTVIRMRSGGISGKNLLSYWISTLEILKSFKINKINTNLLLIIMRIPAKINQLLFYNTHKINSNFERFKIIFDENHYMDNSFKIIKNFKKINLKNNFILSGMNLAFMGYYSNKEVSPARTLYHWPDGIWAKKHINVEKIPGRKLIHQIKLNNKIKKILVLGNLSENSSKFLKNKFKLKITNQELPFGNIEIIKKTKIKITKNTLVFITLPTPKQEKLADYLSKINDNYKIICIGASIAIASGDEKEVPELLKNYEFLWRLKSDTFRRLKRIIETLVYYLKGKYINKTFDNIRFINID
jgi:glycosyltransferase involved in cell wall biosynthesis